MTCPSPQSKGGFTLQMLHIFVTFGSSGTRGLGKVCLVPNRGKSEACFLLAAADDEDEWGWHSKQIFSLSGVFVPHQGTSSHTHLLLSRPIITKQNQRTHEMNNRWLVYEYVPFGLRMLRLFINSFTRKNKYSSYLKTENVSATINQFTEKVNINFKTDIASFSTELTSNRFEL